MQVSPTLEEFIESTKTANVIAITAEISTDLDTPVSIYYKLVGDDQGFILESVAAAQKFGRFSFIGAEPFAQVKTYKNHTRVLENKKEIIVTGNPVQAMKTYLEKFNTAADNILLPLLNGGAIGYLNYESVGTFDRVRGLNIDEAKLLGQFMICRVLVIMDHLKNTAKLVYLAEVNENDDAAFIYNEGIRKIESVKNTLKAAVNDHFVKKDVVKDRKKIDFLQDFGKVDQVFLEKIRIAKEHIAAGDIFQIVLSEQFRCNITKPAFHFYRRLRQINPSPYMFYLNFGEIKLVGSSPEMLVKISGDKVFTYPIAGARPRGIDAQTDAALAAELRCDTKECAEHAMLVDLARNDIGRISKPGTVKVTKLMEVEKFSHVMHMVSEVCGQVKQGSHSMDVLGACFPAGTLSGAPKIRAMEIINELETVERNAYGGTVGYIDFNGNMDMCITIRTIRIEGDEAIIQAGAGIVADSIAEKEYKEILQKAKAMFQTIEEVEDDDFID